jgi:hypothetical protein
MRRGDVLGPVGAATVGLAGYVGDGPPVDRSTDPPEPTDSPTHSPSDDPSPTPSPAPRPVTVTDRSFEVRNVQYGTGNSRATVSHEATGGSAGRVTVEGVVVGSDSCHSARLVEAVLEDGTLRVAVEPYVPEENRGKACADCIVDASYRTVVDYEGERSFDVAVVHDGERVAETGPCPG